MKSVHRLSICDIAAWTYYWNIMEMHLFDGCQQLEYTDWKTLKNSSFILLFSQGIDFHSPPPPNTASELQYMLNSMGFSLCFICYIAFCL